MINGNNSLNHLFNSIDFTLGTQYFDIKNRLKLEFTPKCLLNYEYCNKFHKCIKTKCVIAEKDIVTNLTNLIKSDRAPIFLKYVVDLINRKIFPGEKNLLNLLELILTINKPYHTRYTTDYIIKLCSITFENTLNYFPPCLSSLQQNYCSIFTSKFTIIETKCIQKTNGIFNFIITMLEYVIQEDNESGEHDLSDIINDSMRMDFDSINNFYQFEQKYVQNYQLDELSRNEKIERLFIVLHLLTKLMEYDLSVWMLRYPENPYLFVQFQLISLLIWPTGDIGERNVFIIQLLKLFVNCISIKFPQDKIDILARLINLLCHAINLSEIYIGSDVPYPYIGGRTRVLIDEIKKTIENNPRYNMELYMSTIENIKMPVIKNELINDLIHKFDRNIIHSSYQMLYNELKNHKWLTYHINPDKLKEAISTESFISATYYPVLSEVHNKKRTIITMFQNDYLNLLFLCLKTNLEIFDIEIVMKKLNENGQSKSTERKKNDSIKTFVDKKWDFVKVAQHIAKLERFEMKNLNKSIISYNNDTSFYPNIYLDVPIISKYNSEITYFIKLVNLIKELNNKQNHYGRIFEKFNNLVINKI